MRRIITTFAAMLIPVAGLTLGIAAGTAGAGTVKITCTTLTGSASTTITVSGCTGGDTGGSSVPAPALSLEAGGTTTWVSGTTTSVGPPTLTPVSNTKCPGYVKPPKGTTPPEPSALAVVSAVTADNGNGIALPATSTGEVCVGTDGTITALKSFIYSWTGGAPISCTTITGTATLVISGCTGGNTGGSSTPISAAALALGGTIHWVSGGSATIGAPTLTPTSSKSCPGYLKGAATEPTAEKFAAVLTQDTGDGFKLPGSAKGGVCIGTDGSITALGPLAVK